MVGVDSGSLYRQTHKSSGLVLGRWPLVAVLHSSNEPGELSQWLCHDDSTINIVVFIIIIIIIIINHCNTFITSNNIFSTVSLYGRQFDWKNHGVISE